MQMNQGQIYKGKALPSSHMYSFNIPEQGEVISSPALIQNQSSTTESSDGSKQNPLA